MFSGKLMVNRQGYSWGVLWELVRVYRLNPCLGITPKVCRNLMGKNTTVGPHVRAIVHETRLEESFIFDPGKAERDAQVRGFRFPSVLSKLTKISLHGNILIMRSHR